MAACHKTLTTRAGTRECHVDVWKKKIEEDGRIKAGMTGNVNVSRFDTYN